jgi:N-acetylneuraminate synthase/N,N'-diacetyllegionaminate synthase
MVKLAKRAGASAVKFQLFTAEKLEPPGPRRDMLKQLELTYEEVRELKAHADSLGIECLVTPFDVEALSCLAGLGVERIKIGSADLGNHALLEAAATTGLPLILSTGMAGIRQVHDALRTLGWPDNVTKLHCTSAYPAPFRSVNLQAMASLRRAFGGPVGYSDHTTGIAISLAAAALGADMIEKHFTLDRTAEGPDHAASITVGELAQLVQGVRQIEAAMGDGIKIPHPSERAVTVVKKEREAYRCAT